MIWLPFLLVHLLLPFIVGQDSYGCLSVDWVFHSPTHSCFMVSQTIGTWFTAKYACQKFKGGPFHNRSGHLAIIDSMETNNFILRLLGNKRYGWIGLSNSVRLTEYRWTGGDHEPPTFLNFRQKPRTDITRFVYISSSNWKMAASNNKWYYICQSDATIRPTTLACPQRAVQEGGRLPAPLTCQFHFRSWSSVQWNINGTELATCHNSSNQCRSLEQDYTASLQGRTSNLWYDGEVSRRQMGQWKCLISSWTNTNLVMDTKSCDLQVYAQPTDVTCTSKLTKGELLVSCLTERVFPWATCRWTYKSGTDTSFKAVSATADTQHTQNSYRDVLTSNEYFRSNCSVTLTPRETEFNLGQMEIKVNMVPTVRVDDLSNTPGAFKEQSVIVDIALPPQPVMTVNGNEVNDVITVVETDRMTLEIMCKVKGGSPPVRQTTMWCGFPFTKSGDFHNTWTGITYEFERLGARDMDGKRCSCWGTHITGPSSNRTIRFNVEYRAEIKSFSANTNKYQLTVNAKAKVKLECDATGNPYPLVEIVKKGPDDTQRVLEFGQEGTRLLTEFEAQCEDNAVYECRARNDVKDIEHKDKWDLKVIVRCAPTRCRGSDVTPVKVARVGERAVVELCAHAYPQPTQYDLHQELDRGEWTKVSTSRYAMDYDTSSLGTVRSVRITFAQVASTDIGRYRIYFEKQAGLPYAYLYFKLSRKGPPECPTNASVVTSGTRYALITWVPGPDNGHAQTFTIISQDVARGNLTALGNETPLTFNLTGLDPGTEYFITVEARNREGKSSVCHDNGVNITTVPDLRPLPPQETTAGDTNAVLVPVLVTILLLIVVIIVVVVVYVYFLRRRYNYLDDKTASYTSKSMALRPEVESEGHSYDSTAYASINMADKKKGHPKRTSSRLRPTEAPPRPNVNLHNNDVGYVNQDYFHNHHHHHHDDDGNVYVNTVAAVEAEQATPTKGSCHNNHDVYNNEMEREVAEYVNTPALTAIDNAAAFAAADVTVPSPDEQTETAASSRRPNPDGLIYVDVVVEPGNQRATKSPTAVADLGRHHSDAAWTGSDGARLAGATAAGTAHEAVEYTSIDYLATAEVNSNFDDLSDDIDDDEEEKGDVREAGV